MYFTLSSCSSIHSSYMFEQSTYGRLILLFIVHWKRNLNASDRQEIAFMSLNNIWQSFIYLLFLCKSLLSKFIVNTFWKHCIRLACLAYKWDFLSHLNVIPSLLYFRTLNYITFTILIGILDLPINKFLCACPLFAFQKIFTCGIKYERHLEEKGAVMKRMSYFFFP